MCFATQGHHEGVGQDGKLRNQKTGRKGLFHVLRDRTNGHLGRTQD